MAESNRRRHLPGSTGPLATYLAGELFAAARAEPTLANLRSRRFGVLERPTEITRGLHAAATA